MQRVPCQDRAHANPESDCAGRYSGLQSRSAADPLAAVSTVDQPGAGLVRNFWVELSVALGFVAFSIMGFQFLITARFRAHRRTLWHGHRVRVSPADLVGGLRTNHRAPGHPVRKQPEAAEIAQRF